MNIEGVLVLAFAIIGCLAVLIEQLNDRLKLKKETQQTAPPAVTPVAQVAPQPEPPKETP